MANVICVIIFVFVKSCDARPEMAVAKVTENGDVGEMIVTGNAALECFTNCRIYRSHIFTYNNNREPLQITSTSND